MTENIILRITYKNKARLLKNGKSNIFKVILKEFLKELKNKKTLNINFEIHNFETKLIAVRTTADLEDIKKLREISKNNGVSIATLQNAIISKYLKGNE